MKILLICNDCYHPGIIPRKGLEALAPYGISVEEPVHDAETTIKTLRPYPVVVLAKGNKTSPEDSTRWMDGAAEDAFTQYVQEGGGVVFLHAGAAVKRGAEGMCRLMGHRFTHHPDQCPVTVTPLKPHFITHGVEAFTVIDEHYFINLLSDDADILLASTSQYGTQVAGYVRKVGRGRVCTLTPGHNLDVWLHPGYQVLMRNALEWCAKEENDER